MKITTLLSFLPAMLASLIPNLILAADESPPNVLILLGDDIDRDSLGPWGGEAHTPHLDRLAEEGIRFNRAYANVAMCAPFRQELYSGRTSWRTKTLPNHSKSVEGTRSLPHYLRPLGYQVALVGKRHIGPQSAYPFEFLGGFPKKEDPNPIAMKAARAFMTSARDAGDPFCLVIASNDGHGPYTTGDPSRYDKADIEIPNDAIDTSAYRRSRVKYLAEITNLDALLGSLRELLKEEKLADKTLIIFSSEQGSAYPFGKWTCFNDGLASGVVAALPGVIPQGIASERILWIADIAPTLVEAAGGEIRETDFDGRSQWANFKGANELVHPYAYGAFTNCNILDNEERIYPIRSIRNERFSLIWSPRHDEEITSNVTLTQALKLVKSGKKPSGGLDFAASWAAQAQETQDPRQKAIVHRFFHRTEWALYDLSSDPQELVNRIADPELTDVAQSLKNELMNWLDRWGDSDPVSTERSLVNQN
jgi:uncharacterized sulfatase